MSSNQKKEQLEDAKAHERAVRTLTHKNIHTRTVGVQQQMCVGGGYVGLQR